MKTVSNLDPGDEVSDMTKNVRFGHYETSLDNIETGYLITRLQKNILAQILRKYKCLNEK